MCNKILRYIWRFFLAVGIILIGISFFGKFAYPLDSLAHLRRLLVYALIVGVLPLLFTASRRNAIGIVLFAFLALISTYIPYGIKLTTPSEKVKTFTLIQTNLRFDNKNVEALIHLIEHENPDFVTYQEASKHWQIVIDQIAKKQGYYDFRCSKKEHHQVIGGAGILSRYPIKMDMKQCPKDSEWVDTEVMIGAHYAPFHLSSVHLNWPWPYDLKAQVDALDLKPEKTKLIAGDFNAVTWSNMIQQIKERTETNYIDHAPSWLTLDVPEPLRSFILPVIGLPIDQIFSTADIQIHEVKLLKLEGSDHLPLQIRFSLPTAQ